MYLADAILDVTHQKQHHAVESGIAIHCLALAQPGTVAKPFAVKRRLVGASTALCPKPGVNGS